MNSYDISDLGHIFGLLPSHVCENPHVFPPIKSHMNELNGPVPATECVTNGPTARTKMVTEKCWHSLQCGAPKIAKLVYNYNN